MDVNVSITRMCLRKTETVLTHAKTITHSRLGFECWLAGYWEYLSLFSAL